jgi:hypothetical protein
MPAISHREKVAELKIYVFASSWLWKVIGFGFSEEAGPTRVLHPNHAMEGANLAPMKEEKRLTFHSPSSCRLNGTSQV